mmetsp:Transcript_49793/g.117061  ORF Transcript_49793/g.117061 Transcript_49793/m.117061 type:complete len:206 (-) Transcript_49793:191-808(-)
MSAFANHVSRSCCDTVIPRRSMATDSSVQLMVPDLSESSSSNALRRRPRSVSSQRRGSMPKTQPNAMPTALAITTMRRQMERRSCSLLSCGAGRPSLQQSISTALPRPTPATSLTRLPSAAAASVESPSMRPRWSSIAAPATSMTKLSRKPNPTNGKDCRHGACEAFSARHGRRAVPSASSASWRLSGCGGVGSSSWRGGGRVCR